MKALIQMRKNYRTILKTIRPSGIFVALVIIWLVMLFSSDIFRNLENLLSILRESAFTGICAIGITLCIISGNLDLSVGSMLALLAVLNIMFLPQFGLVGSFLLVIFFGLILGAFNGLLIAKGKIPSFITTLGTYYIFRAIAYMITNGDPVSFNEKWFTIIGNGKLFGVPTPFIIFAILSILGIFILKKTVFGRRILAIGNSLKASSISGISIDNTVIGIYMIVGFFTSICAILVSSRMWSASAGLLEGYEFNVITIVVLGGTAFSGGSGSIANTFISAIFIATLTNCLNLFRVESFMMQIIKGLVLLIAFSIECVKPILIKKLNKVKLSNS